MIVVETIRPNAKSSTRQLIAASARRGMGTGATATMMGRAADATISPATAPAADNTRLSARSCVTSCRGAAPSANRTAISRSRARARVKSSDATLRQPMTSSSPTAPNSTSNAGR